MKKEELIKKEINYYTKVYSENCKKVLELKKKLKSLKESNF